MQPANQGNLGSLQPGAEPVPGYRLVKWIGGGGFGDLWKAETEGGFHVALKFVRQEDKGGAIELRALDIIRNIHHPNLLSTFGAWQLGGYLVIGMELADRSLWDRFREVITERLSGIPREELLEYVYEAAKGIDHLNERK